MCPSTLFLVTLHLLEDSSTDADVTGEWAFLINVLSFNGGLWGLEACQMTKQRLTLANAPTRCLLDESLKTFTTTKIKKIVKKLTYRVQFFCSILRLRMSSWQGVSLQGKFRLASGMLSRVGNQSSFVV